MVVECEHDIHLSIKTRTKYPNDNLADPNNKIIHGAHPWRSSFPWFFKYNRKFFNGDNGKIFFEDKATYVSNVIRLFPKFVLT